MLLDIRKVLFLGRIWETVKLKKSEEKSRCEIRVIWSYIPSLGKR